MNQDTNSTPKTPPASSSNIPPSLVGGGSTSSAATMELSDTTIKLPRVTIEFCTQCRWGLRAAYYAQELLSTFSTSLPEISLLPSTGGTFIIRIYHTTSPPTQNPTLRPGPSSSSTTGPEAARTPPSASVKAITTMMPNAPGTIVSNYDITTLWDRRVDGGFPETKELKRRVRDVIDPGRGLGHVDKDYGVEKKDEEEKEGGGVEKGEKGEAVREEGDKGKKECENCK